METDGRFRQERKDKTAMSRDGYIVFAMRTSLMIAVTGFVVHILYPVVAGHYSDGMASGLAVVFAGIWFLLLGLPSLLILHGLIRRRGYVVGLGLFSDSLLVLLAPFGFHLGPVPGWIFFIYAFIEIVLLVSGPMYLSGTGANAVGE